MKCSKFKESTFSYQSTTQSNQQNASTPPIVVYQTFKQKDTRKSFKQSINSLEASNSFFHQQKLNQIKAPEEDTQLSKRAFHFSSNQIAKKELTMLKNKQSNGQFMETLINQTIDFTVLPNSTLFGKSIFDCSRNYHCKVNSARLNKQSIMQPVYLTTPDKDKIKLADKAQVDVHIAKSNVCFKYGEEIKRIHSKDQCLKTNPTEENPNKNKANEEKALKRLGKANGKTKKAKRKEEVAKLHKEPRDAASDDSYVSNKMNEHNEERVSNYRSIYRIRLSSNSNTHDNPADKTEIEFAPILKVESNLNDHCCKEKECPIQNTPLYLERIGRSDIKKESPLTTDSEMIANKVKEFEREEENGTDISKENNCDLFTQENIKTKHVYSSEPVYTLNDIWYKNSTNIEKVTEKFNSFIQKFMPQPYSSFHSHAQPNRSLSMQITLDSDEIDKLKKQIVGVQQYYSNQISKIQYEMRKKEESRYRMDESQMSKASSTSLPLFSKQDKIRLIMEKLDHLDASLSQKEKNYKLTVTALLKELEDASKSSTTQALHEDLIKEAKDFLNDDENFFKLRRKEMNIAVNAKESPQMPHPDSRRTNVSLLNELESFKKEESSYKFEIPQKYQNMHLAKCVKEEAIKGKLVRFYDNSVIDIIDKKKTIKRLFPDGYEISYYSNKDIQLKLSNGRLYFFYSKNKSFEFRFLNGNCTVYKFLSGQYEKHYFDNATSIKFTDGSYRITRPNGEELMQFPDGTIQYSGPKGKVLKPKAYEPLSNNVNAK